MQLPCKDLGSKKYLLIIFPEKYIWYTTATFDLCDCHCNCNCFSFRPPKTLPILHLEGSCYGNKCQQDVIWPNNSQLKVNPYPWPCILKSREARTLASTGAEAGIIKRKHSSNRSKDEVCLNNWEQTLSVFCFMLFKTKVDSLVLGMVISANLILAFSTNCIQMLNPVAAL